VGINRRQWFASVAAGSALATVGCTVEDQAAVKASTSEPLVGANGEVDWTRVRGLFPLRPDWIHLASFLFVSHPTPVAEAIERFRKKIDEDPVWLELAALTDSEGRPFRAIKQTLAEYIGGAPEEICLTSNTTTALAMVYHGLRLRSGQEIVTTAHDHYSHHESIRLAAERAGARVRRIDLYDQPERASAAEIVSRIERAIQPETRVLGVTWVHSSTGVKLPLTAIADVVARANRGRASADRCLLIVDGVHGLGNQDVEVAKLGCDFFAAGTHKWLFAPRGTGFLWGRAELWPELRPTIPTFDPDALQAWGAWMNQAPMPPTTAAIVSPGGFLAFENFLAIPAAVALHHSIGRNRIAARIQELSGVFRSEAVKIPGVTLHTPQDPELSAGLSAFEVEGVSAEEVANRLAAKQIRTNSSPYKVSYARVSTGIMNSPADVAAVLREIRALTSKSA
jgi:isopenicillin-N epimerase